jgi:hypothetical protein
VQRACMHATVHQLDTMPVPMHAVCQMLQHVSG